MVFFFFSDNGSGSPERVCVQSPAHRLKTISSPKWLDAALEGNGGQRTKGRDLIHQKPLVEERIDPNKWSFAQWCAFCPFNPSVILLHQGEVLHDSF